MNTKETIVALIIQGKLQEAIQLWLSNLAPDDPARTIVTQLSARINGLINSEITGVIPTSESTLIRNQITQAALVSLKEWIPGGSLSGLEQAITKLGIHSGAEISAIHLVNCDRTSQSKSFRRAFNEKVKSHQDFQFYFICGCPNEMPGSFAKRLIYEIIRDKLDGVDDTINYPFQEGIDRIKIEDLPLGDDLESSKKRLKTYVSKRFQFTDTQTFESFIDTGVPKLPYDFVTAIFEISDKKWEGDEGEIQAYFEWMMQTFRNPHHDVPTFLFFIVLKSQNLWFALEKLSTHQKTILTDLEALCASHQEQSILLRDFPPVDDQDLDVWLSELGVRNPNFSKLVVTALANTFKAGSEEKTLYETEKRFHMKDIEPVQKMIYDVAQY
jgi:hypothetical protein